MSLHKDPKYNTPDIRKALQKHGFSSDGPSQLSDAFRLGYAQAIKDAAGAAEKRARERVYYTVETSDFVQSRNAAPAEIAEAILALAPDPDPAEGYAQGLSESASPEVAAAIRSQAIGEFSTALGVKGSDVAKALPDDVRHYRMDAAVRQIKETRTIDGDLHSWTDPDLHPAEADAIKRGDG